MMMTCNVLPINQSGIRKNYSTITAFLTFVDNIRKADLCKQNLTTKPKN